MKRSVVLLLTASALVLVSVQAATAGPAARQTVVARHGLVLGAGGPPGLVAAAGSHRPGGPHRPAAKGTTTTTVMGGGKPSTWPAAKPYPPSLAGAYSPNMKRAFLTLIRYSDWVGSHPNPKLVKNYSASSSDIYRAQVFLMRQMKKRGWHLPATPTRVDFLAVVKKPVVRHSKSGLPLMIAHRLAYTFGVVDVVVYQVTEPYLDGADHVVGHTAKGNGPKPWSVILGQNPISGQFVITGYYAIVVHGSLRQWERKVVRNP